MVFSKRQRILLFIILIFHSILGGHVKLSAQDSYTIYFKQGYATLDYSYLNNAVVLDSLQKEISNNKIDSISIFAAASPEGDYRFNKKLAVKRANTLLRVFNQDTIKYSINTISEDWNEWARIINETYFGEYKDAVVGIILSDQPSIVKKRLLKQYPIYNELIHIYAVYCRKATVTFVNSNIIHRNNDFLEYIPLDKKLLDSLVYQQDTLTILPPKSPVKDTPTQEYIYKTIASVKSNLLYDATTFLNYSVEVPIGNKVSLSIEHICPWLLSKDNTKCNQTIILEGGIKYWLGKRTYINRLEGHALGVYVFSGKSDLQWNTNICYQTRGYSAGFTYSYSKKLCEYLNFEVCLGVGYANVYYQHYNPTTDYQILFRDRIDYGRLSYFGPTKLEVTLAIPIKAKFKLK